ncbi:MAG: DinB family protein [Candidatus Acidiferrales bacterium]
MKKSSCSQLCSWLAAVTLLVFSVLVACPRLAAQAQSPQPAQSRTDEVLRMWNDIGNKLVAMAQDFPEDKYDFKVQKDERTFAENLLHAAALDFVLIRRISGSNLGPDFGEGDNPSRDAFKTKADVVKFVQEAVADGAKVIQQQGDAGLDNTAKFFGNRLAHNSYIWTFAIEHSAEHYGQLVVYYRANNLIPPDSRRNQAQPSQQPPQPPQPPPTIASTVDREISAIEKQIVEVAEAMPEDKFNFSPDSLNIPGSDYKGVRTFAVQVKHVAASNYFIWSPITGDKLPEGLKDGNGPENLTTKSDIIKFLKDSFALGHKAAAMLTTENMLQPVGHNNSPRLHLAEFGVAHAYNHYGQMVEYLRMNGIAPPASRTPSD